MPRVDNPILLDIPAEVRTPRLLLRVPRQGDGRALYEAVHASRAELSQWLTWPDRVATPELAEIEMRQAGANFILRTHFIYLMWAQDDGRLVGVIMVLRFDWSVPKCEIGYWLHNGETGKGYMVEAVKAMTEFCFDHLQMERIEIWCDTRNQASARVAQRSGYTFEGFVKNVYRDGEGNLTLSECYYILPP